MTDCPEGTYVHPETVLPELRDFGPTMTVQEVARLLSVTPATIMRQIDSGHLPALRVGPRAVRLRTLIVSEVLDGKRNLAGDPGEDDDG